MHDAVALVLVEASGSIMTCPFPSRERLGRAKPDCARLRVTGQARSHRDLYVGMEDRGKNEDDENSWGQQFY